MREETAWLTVQLQTQWKTSTARGKTVRTMEMSIIRFEHNVEAEQGFVGKMHGRARRKRNARSKNMREKLIHSRALSNNACLHFSS
jgi:hypothetical protein